jgi:hypothetical protein
MVRLICAVLSVAALSVATGSGVLAAPSDSNFKQAERVCESHGGFFSELDLNRGYACLFGGEFPEAGFGSNYDNICARYDGTIFEEAPPPYGYTCSLN